MVGEVCLPNNAFYPRTPNCTLYSGVHVCWSEHSNFSFVYGFMSLDYGLGTMTTTTDKSANYTDPTLPLIQEGQLSVSGERMCTILVNCLED